MSAGRYAETHAERGNSDDETELVHAGMFGNEIVHLTQHLEGTGPGSLYNEIEAYNVESKIFKNLGLTENNSVVKDAAYVASSNGSSAEEIMNSGWANQQHNSFPLTNKSIRFFDDLKYNHLIYRWHRLLHWLDQ